MAPSGSRTTVTRPAFHQYNARRLFTLEIAPIAAPRAQLLYLPPYAEEMNRSRCHVAATCRLLAQAGWRCLILDHHGTGESDGESTEADWDDWYADALEAARQMLRDSPAPLTLWGLRSGALLAAELAHRAEVAVERLLLWQPVLDGRTFLNQYLRLRVASQMVHGGERETTATIMQRLEAGETIEVAGYPLAQRLAAGLVTRKLSELPPQAVRRVDWVEVASQAGQDLPPGSQRVCTAWAGHGEICTTTVTGPQFWQLAGDHPAPDLVQATARLMGASA